MDRYGKTSIPSDDLDFQEVVYLPNRMDMPVLLLGSKRMGAGAATRIIGQVRLYSNLAETEILKVGTLYGQGSSYVGDCVSLRKSFTDQVLLDFNYLNILAPT